MSSLTLPDGSLFPLWDDITVYTSTYHVDQAHPEADDSGPGTAARPWRSISAAAARLQAGEEVVIHPGIYRERVAPARGGRAADHMICYRAAEPGTVVISATEAWPTANWQPLHRGRRPQLQNEQNSSHQRPQLWIADLPCERFIGRNPFEVAILPRLPWYPWKDRPVSELIKALRKCGSIIHCGKPLAQVDSLRALSERDGQMFIPDGGTQVVVRLGDDVDPNQEALEFTVHEQCFAPRQRSLGWIRVCGITCDYAANAIPNPQRGAISTSGGHHWIIEDCAVRHANAVGIDIGLQAAVYSYQAEAEDEGASGGHIVRRNRISDIGIQGLSGTDGMRHCLIEDNRIERIGLLGFEFCYEAAAIKFHMTDRCLIRRNRLHDLRDACGIWLDYQCRHSRVSHNRITKVHTVLAGIYIEANLEANLVDGNIIAGCRDIPENNPPKDGFIGGNGLSTDVCDGTIFDSNLVVNCQGHAIAAVLAQKGRIIAVSSAMLADIRITNNLVLGCTNRLILDRPQGATVDGNRYGGHGFSCIREADRTASLNSEAFARHFSFDCTGGPIELRASYDPERDCIHIHRPSGTDLALPIPGPLSPAQQQQLLSSGSIDL